MDPRTKTQHNTEHISITHLKKKLCIAIWNAFIAVKLNFKQAILHLADKGGIFQKCSVLAYLCHWEQS